MLTGLKELILRYSCEQRYKKLDFTRKHGLQVQDRLFKYLLNKYSYTEKGREFGLTNGTSYTAFNRLIPLGDYETHKADIHRMMMGEEDILWPGRIDWFSKSSGTTNDKSKFIPCSRENIKSCHIQGSRNTMAFLYHWAPNLKVTSGKNLVMGGSLNPVKGNPQAHVGDVSAVMISHLPSYVKEFYTPDFEIALHSNWDIKLDGIVQTIKNENLIMFGGVPTWLIVIFRKVLEITGKKNLLEVWPELSVYLHGGVGFDPYKTQFKELIPKSDFIYLETYNASEGFFAAQDERDKDDMLLFLDNGIFYEFIPEEEMDKEDAKAIPLEGVQLYQKYALVISTNGGLWRYKPGDVVEFTSVLPYKIKVAGRTKQFINVFGEEVMISDTDEAITRTCTHFNVSISDYTVAPIFFEGLNQKGGHEWIIEFVNPPSDLKAFASVLDSELQHINSDYEAKRTNDLALLPLQLRIVPSGTFYAWMRSRGKLGTQNKVPRLSNQRVQFEEILSFAK